ncbi:MAG TPA: ABC transporter ATP-binding protein [Virgibacillus sp.]|nr:ABC transporter ATP-binding protein [Virgibacillus sp.]
MKDVLITDRLTKKFNDFIAVDNMSLTVKQGEIFGFLGANGAGKSTAIHMVTGLLQKTDGEITIFGKDHKKNRTDIKKEIGLVPQEIAIYEDLTAYENVEFFAGLYDLRGANLKEQVMEALEFVGLSDKKKQYPKTFSGGMKRRLNIACAIAHRPKLIIMDEPTVGIDPQSRNYILKSVQQLNENGCTIIYTSHYMEEVEAICTRIAIVDNGKIIAEGTKKQLQSLITDSKRILIEVKDPEHVDISAIEHIRGVTHVQLKETTLEITTELGSDHLNDLLQYFMDQGIDIRSVDEKEPNLETVFLTLTGRNLRDA